MIRWSEWRLSRSFIALAMALMLVLSSAVGVLAQATPEADDTAGEAGPALGDAVVLFDSRGDELLQIAVTEMVDPDDAIEGADRGFFWVGIQVVVSNSSDSDVDFNAYAIQLVDEQGFIYNQGFASRDDEDYTARPDFTESTVPAGEAISGWIFYQVVNGATIDWIVFSDPFSAQQFAVLANLAGQTVEDGAQVPFYDAGGDEVGTSSVDEIVTEFEDVDSEVSPPRGSTVVGVSVTIENTGTDDVQPSSSSFLLVDDLGYVYYPAFYFRGEESLAQYPEFTGDVVAAGDAVTGYVLFEIPGDAEVAYVVFQPDFSQAYIIAQPGEGSTVSGEELTPVPNGDTGDDTGDDTGTDTGDTGDDTGDDTGNGDVVESGECVGVKAWSDTTQQNLDILNQFEDVDSLADVEPGELRDAADQLRDTADEQANLDTPEIAQEANDAVIDMLNAFADLFDEAADRLDDGDDPADIEADFENNETFNTSFETFFTAFTELSTACPDSTI